MKTLVTLILSLFLFTPELQVGKETVTITVSIEGLRNKNGYVAVALHDGQGDFPDDDGIQEKYVEVNGSTVEVIFKDVPVGEYAIAFMHDENGNEELDFNEYGMPLEGYGFSNDAQGEMGPPSFSAASFSAEADTEVSIFTIYLGGY